MTNLLFFNHPGETRVANNNLSSNILAPPKLTVSSLFHDYKWHLGLYRRAKLPITTIIVFLCLRTIQFVSYELGWKNAVK